MRTALLSNYIIRNFYFSFLWLRNSFIGGRPEFIKRAVLKKYGLSNSVWIETGTYLGQTTRFLSTISNKVISFEPDPALFQRACRMFRRNNGVELVNLASEDGLSSSLEDVDGNCNFWLDGHFSGGLTFQGQQNCPVLQELSLIKIFLKPHNSYRIFIDDINCFYDDRLDTSYPVIDDLIAWGRENQFSWLIENNILILTRN